MLKELNKKLSRLEKLAERIQENKIRNCKAKSQKALSRDFLDEQFIERLPKLGDLAFVKALETAYKLIGAIQPARTQFNNQNNNAAGVVHGNTLYEVHESAWKIKKDFELAERARLLLEAENPEPPPIS
jgi:hypothetical protein